MRYIRLINTRMYHRPTLGRVRWASMMRFPLCPGASKTRNELVFCPVDCPFAGLPTSPHSLASCFGYSCISAFGAPRRSIEVTRGRWTVRGDEPRAVEIVVRGDVHSSPKRVSIRRQTRCLLPDIKRSDCVSSGFMRARPRSRRESDRDLIEEAFDLGTQVSDRGVD
jgi:hypothetical protein